MASSSKDAQLRRRRAIGRLIVDLRRELTQTELGIKLAKYQPDGQPIPQTTISRWERGTIDMTFEQANEIELALNVPPGTLARAGGYVAADDSYQNVEDLIRVDSSLDPEVREDVVRVYRSYVNVSRRYQIDEFVQSPKRRRVKSE